jgi:hypothetical protein
MIKEDEKELWYELQISKTMFFPLDIIHMIGMNEKRACYILQKWTDRGIWNYGGNPLFGWFEDELNPKYYNWFNELRNYEQLQIRRSYQNHPETL